MSLRLAGHVLLARVAQPPESRRVLKVGVAGASMTELNYEMLALAGNADSISN
jgi:hypothetical protein